MPSTLKRDALIFILEDLDKALEISVQKYIAKYCKITRLKNCLKFIW